MTVEDTSNRVPEEESPAALWEQNRPAVFAYVFGSVQDYHRAQDIVQEVAVAVATDFHKFDRERSFLAWVTGIARNRVLEFYRKQKKDRIVLNEATLVALGQAVERLRIDRMEDQRVALRHCMEKLDSRRKLALELRYTDNLRVAEIAERIGATANAAKILLHRARLSLGECIERRLSAGSKG